MNLRSVVSAVALLVGVSALAAAPDFRPPLDKSAYRGTIAAHANPWFPLDKAPLMSSGGPNVFWPHLEGEDLWARGMEFIRDYGVGVWDFEINEPTSWAAVYRKALDEMARRKSRATAGMFFAFCSPTWQECLASMKRILEPFREDLKSNPHVARIGGAPIVFVTRPFQYPPEDMRRLFDALDAEFGRMAYLGDYFKCDIQKGEAEFERRLRTMMPYLDGVTGYACGQAGDGEGQRKVARIIRRVMADWPGKVRETVCFQSYMNHFHTGGTGTDLTRGWRESVDAQLSENPDSLQLCNLNDGWENSLLFPNYEREDFELRYLEYAAAEWRRTPFRACGVPELAVASEAVVQLGWDPLKYEVMGFPIRSAAKDVTATLEICDASGRVLHAFPSRKLTLDRFRVERFEIPSERFAGERGVVPRLRYTWAGRERRMNFGPLTVIDPSLRGYRMYYVRSTRNQLEMNGENAWTLNGVPQGGTSVHRTPGRAVLSSGIRAVTGGPARDTVGYGRNLVKRDGSELWSGFTPASRLEAQLPLQLPEPGAALHWYHLEQENGKGRRYQTLPIWEVAAGTTETVSLPVWCGTNRIERFEVEKCRVPFWWYPCDEANGALLVDRSGWNHDGVVVGKGAGGEHLGFTGYNHLHMGPLGAANAETSRMFRRDADGRGYYHFEGGTQHISLMGGTAFPGACTYELMVRPTALGEESALVSSGYQQLEIRVLADGRLRVLRRGKSFESKARLEVGRWTRLAAVCDLEKLTLFVDGQEDSSVVVGTQKIFASMNHVFVGSGMGWVWAAKDGFVGDIRRIRITGRNLDPDEFLK